MSLLDLYSDWLISPVWDVDLAVAGLAAASLSPSHAHPD